MQSCLWIADKLYCWRTLIIMCFPRVFNIYKSIFWDSLVIIFIFGFWLAPKYDPDHILSLSLILQHTYNFYNGNSSIILIKDASILFLSSQCKHIVIFHKDRSGLLQWIVFMKYISWNAKLSILFLIDFHQFQQIPIFNQSVWRLTIYI